MADSASARPKRTCSMPERVQLHVSMLALQFGYAGFHIVSRAALNMGISKLVFPVYRNIIALILLVPFAYFLEKKDRPAITLSFLVQFFFLALCGITANQGFYLLGLDNTSPTFASAIQNSVPAITFLMAAILRHCCDHLPPQAFTFTSDSFIITVKTPPSRCLRMIFFIRIFGGFGSRIEKVRLNRRDGIAKVLGTLASVGGASVITLFKGPTIFGPPRLTLPAAPVAGAHASPLWLGDASGKNWTLGCLFLIGHCLSWSGWLVLQAPVLKKYPARLSVTSYTCFFGVIQFLIIAAFVERDLASWTFHSGGEVFTILYAGFVASGIAFAVQIWCIDRGGPVFVAVYQPVQTLVVAIMASIALGEEFYLGGIIGAVLIVAGLYMVLWGKSQERAFDAKEKTKTIAHSSDHDGRTAATPTSSNGSSLTQPLLPSPPLENV